MNHIIINILSLALTVCVKKQMCISYNNACQVSVTSAQFNSANFIFKKSIDKLDKTLCSALEASKFKTFEINFVYYHSSSTV